MKKIFLTIITSIFFLFSVQSQNTNGTDFWLTFGKNNRITDNPNLRLQIRIVGGVKQTEGTIYFTNLQTYINFNVNPNEVYDYDLNFEQRVAVYNTLMGKTDYSVHITTSEPVSVFAMNQFPNPIIDVTNILPVSALSTGYYHISYTRNTIFLDVVLLDGYAVVATKNNTQLYHNGNLVETLNAGEVYYRTSDADMTGSYITSNYPVAFFAVHQGCYIPPDTGIESNLFQQLTPINTWGKRFFVPVSAIDKEIIRIVAAHNNTNITQTGGTIRTGIPGSQTSLNNLQAGQFVELDISLSANGCYIEANNPVGVCAYFRGYMNMTGLGVNPAQCWIPAIEQNVTHSLIAPFIPSITNPLHKFFALVVTPTATKNNTTVSIGGAPPALLPGGGWHDNAATGMSFYSFELTNTTVSYIFSNPVGLIVYGYACSLYNSASYYHLASSAMRDLDAAFYANDIHFQDLKENPFCAGLVEFRAEINGLHPNAADKIRWFIDGAEQFALQNNTLWNKTFSVGEYEIKMIVRYENDETATKIGTLKIIPCNYSAEFFANNIPYGELSNHTICNKTGKVDFRAEIEGIHPEAGSLKWFIDKNDGNGFQEELTAQDQLTWSKDFATGTYEIKMVVQYDNGETAEIISTLKVEIFWIKMQNVRH